jgi:hypothetical protein
MSFLNYDYIYTSPLPVFEEEWYFWSPYTYLKCDIKDRFVCLSEESQWSQRSQNVKCFPPYEWIKKTVFTDYKHQ